MRRALEFTCISARTARDLGTCVDSLLEAAEERLLIVTKGNVAVVHSGTRTWLGPTYLFNAVRFTPDLFLTLEFEPDASEDGQFPVAPSPREVWIIRGAVNMAIALGQTPSSQTPPLP